MLVLWTINVCGISGYHIEIYLFVIVVRVQLICFISTKSISI